MNDSPLTSDVVAIYLEINKDQVFNNWCLFFLLVILPQLKIEVS